MQFVAQAEKAKKASKLFKIAVFSDVEKFLLIDNLDIVFICIESGKHMEPIITAARAGNHIITEKPLEVSLEQVDKIINVCREEGVKLAMIFQNRLNPAYIKLKEVVESGQLGNLILGNAYIKLYRTDS